MKIAVAIKIGNPETSLDLIKKTVGSYATKLGTKEFVLIVRIEEHLEDEIEAYLREKYGDKLILLDDRFDTWGAFITEAINRAEGAEYFMQCHDDIRLVTSNFIYEIERKIEPLNEPIGWISFTDMGYLHGIHKPPIRGGWHADYLRGEKRGFNKNEGFHYHNLPEQWYRPPPRVDYPHRAYNAFRRLLNFEQKPTPVASKEYYAAFPWDFPDGPVRAHIPYSDIKIIKMDLLKELGECETFGVKGAIPEHDFDWALRPLKRGRFNVWLPDIYYHHQIYNRHADRDSNAKETAHDRFVEKWGFHWRATGEELNDIEEMYTDTNIPWAIGRLSYDWDYLE